MLVNNVSSLCVAWDIILRLPPEDAVKFIKSKHNMLEDDVKLVVSFIKEHSNEIN